MLILKGNWFQYVRRYWFPLGSGEGWRDTPVHSVPSPRVGLLTLPAFFMIFCLALFIQPEDTSLALTVMVRATIGAGYEKECGPMARELICKLDVVCWWLCLFIQVSYHMSKIIFETFLFRLPIQKPSLGCFFFFLPISPFLCNFLFLVYIRPWSKQKISSPNIKWIMFSVRF